MQCAALLLQELLPLRPGRRVQPALVTGDTTGTISIFRPTGELLVEFDTGNDPSQHTNATPLKLHLSAAMLLRSCVEVSKRPRVAQNCV